jgi:Fe-Mn family superoxide dismutase
MPSVWRNVLRRQAANKLEFDELRGVVSPRALAEHYKLYEGYVETLARVDESLQACPRPDRHLADHPYRAIKEAETYAIGGVLLHEMYFGNLSANPGAPPAQIIQAITTKWGSPSAWWTEMRAAALTARGWVLLGMCEIDPNDMRIFMLDSHNVGAMAGYSPLCAIDVFEHAYWMDHGANRTAYLDGLPRFLKWSEINRRYMESLAAIQARKPYA